MEASPFPVKVILAVLLVAVIAQAFFGRPPRRRGSRALIAALGISGATAWAVGLLGVYVGTSRAGAAIALGVFALSAARWLAAGHDDGDDDGGGGEPPCDPPRSEPPPSLDWDAFDRAREGWGGPRPRSRDPVA